MKTVWISILISFALMPIAALPAQPHPATKPVLIEVAPAGEGSFRLAIESKDDDPLTQAARRAADDPSSDLGSLQSIESVRIRDEQEWESNFSADMGSAFQGAADAVDVGFEYAPIRNTSRMVLASRRCWPTLSCARSCLADRSIPSALSHSRHMGGYSCVTTSNMHTR